MKTTISTLLIAVIVLAACGAATPTVAPAIDQPVAIPATATPQPVATTPPQPTATLASRCQPADPALLATIAAGLTVDGGGDLPAGQIVRSADFENAYFIAARITGPGLDNTVGLWVSNRPDGAGSIYAVDAIASEFSDWADGRTTGAAFSQADDGAQEAINCAKTGP